MRLSALGLVLLSTLCIAAVGARAQDAQEHAQGGAHHAAANQNHIGCLLNFVHVENIGARQINPWHRAESTRQKGEIDRIFL